MTGASTSSAQLPEAARGLLARIADRSARIGIVGMGYVGLPLALLFSEEGFRVTGFDVDPVKVAALNSGNSYIVRIPAAEIQAARTRGFSATGDYAAISAIDAVIICVPTPLNEFHEPDLSYITGTASAIAPHLRPHQLIILESTTYPGTTGELLIPLLNKGNPAGLCAESAGSAAAPEAPLFYAAFSPEREDPGNDTVARRDIPKVIGAAGPVSRQLACALYGSIFSGTVPVSSPAAAEMTKLLENIYRCVNIALVNELKQLCERMDIDIFEVIDAAKTKPFGFQAFYPGPGLGGHCIPIDPFYLSWKAREFDFRTRFIELAGEINTQMPYYVVERTGEALNQRRKPLQGAKILILGIAYKRDIDDLRESPALTIIELLRRRGAAVAYNDPYFARVGQGRHYALNMGCTPLDNLAEYDAVLIVTDHSSYDYPRIVRESQLVIDTRNATKGLASPSIVRC
ncbi:MAG TPA: nucleotide sugar dehydrogenase [Acidobacteriaceae bacterium]|nr:nucleotide sugar dehydrogenase [Acidobacteriaceae bacterium]